MAPHTQDSSRNNRPSSSQREGNSQSNGSSTAPTQPATATATSGALCSASNGGQSASSSSSSSYTSSAPSTYVTSTYDASGRWASSIRLENRVGIEPSAPENVTTGLPLHYRGSRFSADGRKAGGRGAPVTSSVPAAAPSDSANEPTQSSSIVSYCCNVSVCLKGVGFQDSDSAQLVKHMETQFFNVSPVESCATPTSSADASSDTVYFVSLDISENQLTCQGLQTLTKWFMAHCRFIRLRNLKVYKNMVSDIAALSLAELILAQPTALEEVHLSHNRITALGAAALFKSFSHARRVNEDLSRRGSSLKHSGTTGCASRVGSDPQTLTSAGYVYPRQASNWLGRSSGPAFLPVWIRLEYNYIADTQSLLQKWEADCRSLRNYDSNVKLACFADRPNFSRGSKDPHCSPARCLRSGNGHAPLLHLYSFVHQSTPPPSTPMSMSRASAPATAILKQAATAGPTTVTASAEKPSRIAGTTTSAATTTTTVQKSASNEKQVQAELSAIKYSVPSVSPGRRSVGAVPKKKIDKQSGAKVASVEATASSHQKSSLLSNAVPVVIQLSGQPSVIVQAPLPATDVIAASFQHDHFSSAARDGSGDMSRIPVSAVREAGDLIQSSSQDSPSASGHQAGALRPELIDSAVVGVGRVQKRSVVPLNEGSDASAAAVGKVQPISGDPEKHHPPDSNLGYQDMQSSFSSNANREQPPSSCLPPDQHPRQAPPPRGSTIHDAYSMFSQTSRPPRMVIPPDHTRMPPADDSANFGSSPQQHIRSPRSGIPASTSGSNSLPLYLFVDASAFSEMRKLKKGTDSNLFSFPGIFALCEKRVLCHSSMEPIFRSRQYNTLSQSDLYNTTDEDESVERLDANQSLILMVVNSVGEGLLSMTDSQPFLREALVNLQKDFIGQLSQIGVVESIEDLGGGSSDRWMILDQDSIEKASALGVPMDALRVIDFAFVWAHHLAKVSGTTDIAASSASSGDSLRPAFALFITSNPRVERFFSSLVARQKAGVERRYMHGEQCGAVVPAGNVLCLTLERFNQILRGGYPRLASMLSSAGAFDRTDQPYLDGQEVVSASSIRQLIHNQMSNLSLALDSDYLFASRINSNMLEPPPLQSRHPEMNYHDRQDSSVLHPLSCKQPVRLAAQPEVDAEWRRRYDELSNACGGLDLVEFQRLQQDNSRWRREMQKACRLMSELLICSDNFREEDLIHRCKVECAHWERLLSSSSDRPQQPPPHNQYSSLSRFLPGDGLSSSSTGTTPGLSAFQTYRMPLQQQQQQHPLSRLKNPQQSGYPDSSETFHINVPGFGNNTHKPVLNSSTIFTTYGCQFTRSASLVVQNAASGLSRGFSSRILGPDRQAPSRLAVRRGRQKGQHNARLSSMCLRREIPEITAVENVQQLFALGLHRKPAIPGAIQVLHIPDQYVIQFLATMKAAGDLQLAGFMTKVEVHADSTQQSNAFAQGLPFTAPLRQDAGPMVSLDLLHETGSLLSVRSVVQHPNGHGGQIVVLPQKRVRRIITDTAATALAVSLSTPVAAESPAVFSAESPAPAPMSSNTLEPLPSPSTMDERLTAEAVLVTILEGTGNRHQVGGVINRPGFRQRAQLLHKHEQELQNSIKVAQGHTPEGGGLQKIAVRVLDKDGDRLGYDDVEVLVKAIYIEMNNTLKQIVSASPQYRECFEQVASFYKLNIPLDLADLVVSLSFSKRDDHQAFLEMYEQSIETKLQKALEMVKKDLEIVLLQAQVKSDLEERFLKDHKKYLLLEQMKVLKKELGIDKDEKPGIQQTFKDALVGKKLPPETEKVVNYEMTRISNLEPTSPEYSVCRTYLEWLTNLPWGIVTEDNKDIEKAQAILNEDHYGLQDVKDRLLEFIAVTVLRNGVQGKIICLVGPPGIGKTSIAKSIARALGRKFYRFSLSGLQDAAELKGHRRTYIAAMPGKFVQALKQTETSNPLILLDEIDKMGSGFRGDPSSILLEVLDPNQNSAFRDHYLDVPLDLSNILFICTANSIDQLSLPLRDRMEFIRLSGYVLDEKKQIALNYLIPQVAKETGLSSALTQLHPDVIDKIIKDYARESGVRGLLKSIERIYRKVALQAVRKATVVKLITLEHLVSFLGHPQYSSDRLFPETPPGVAMGLAWTSMGGATLFVESQGRIVRNDADDSGGQKEDAKPWTSKNKGAAEFSVTGRLGPVMTESCQIALSFIKKFLAEFDPANEFLDSVSFMPDFFGICMFSDQAQVHLHIPEGATEKDGPSAGITMATALASLALQTPVAANFAMTGELTLTGKVLRIGGLREKVIAAKRESVTVILSQNMHHHS